MISAEVICDSISPAGKRLTTFKLRYPKFIHGEFMTHRVISRNASSSRAIPTAKLLEEVRSDALRAAPVFWGKNQAGMQAAEELSDEFNGIITPSVRQNVKDRWKIAALSAANVAEVMHNLGTHKQIVNRLLEPFSHINVVATATEWDNFFGLRLHHMAQPEMRVLAEVMWAARVASKPIALNPGDWHWPFVDSETKSNVYDYSHDPYSDTKTDNEVFKDTCIKISVARCARVSYESFETGKRSTIEEDLKVYARLNLPGSEAHDPTQPIHASPAEHQATPDEVESYDLTMPMELSEEQKARRELPISMTLKMKHPHEWGNLVGWRQFRKTLTGEAVAPLPAGYL